MSYISIYRKPDLQHNQVRTLHSHTVPYRHAAYTDGGSNKGRFNDPRVGTQQAEDLLDPCDDFPCDRHLLVISL
jgi:hypothetical protein